MVLVSLGMSFRTHHGWSDYSSSSHYGHESQIATNRQDQDLNYLIVPAFIATFASSLITNLLFPSTPFQIEPSECTIATTKALTRSSRINTSGANTGCRCGIEGGNRVVGGTAINPVIKKAFLLFTYF